MTITTAARTGSSHRADAEAAPPAEGASAPASAPAATSSAPAVETTRFRRAINHLPTGTSVVTALDGEHPLGMTVGSVAAASYDPPLVVFFAADGSSTARVVENTGRFGVNVLGRGAEHLAYRFASRGEDKFAEVELLASASGLPRLAEAMLWLDCEVQTVFPAGDHTGFLGRVVDYDSTSHRVQPLVYCKSRISPLHPGSGRHLPTEALGWWAQP